MQDEQPKQPIPESETEKLHAVAVTEAKEKALRYYHRRVNDWLQHHTPQEKLPIIVDKEGNSAWLNRAQRRKMKWSSKGG